jgi:Mg2+-importing ATPase
MNQLASPTETQELLRLSRMAAAEVCLSVGSSLSGLSVEEAAGRLKQYGPNVVSNDQRPSMAAELWGRARNPLNALLLSLAAVSYALGDMRAAIVVLVMVVLAIATTFVQEHRSNEAAARLRSMVKSTASVRQQGRSKEGEFVEVPLDSLVPGDIVHLSAGDMIPGDLRVLEAKDLFINQSVLTGEAMPAEKFPAPYTGTGTDPFDLPNICFMGASVVSGFAVGVVVHTGLKTFFGELASKVAAESPPTAFDKGIAQFTWLMIRFLAVMVPLVFLINGFTKHDWLEALMFAVAVAVGLTPEMLPMIVTVNLAKGALAMSRAKVIVKRLNAIQNLGAMDILCTDKTGTLTQDRIILKRHLDLHGNESDRVLQYAWLNSHFQSGLKNLLDVAVLDHVDMHGLLGIDKGYAKFDEIPFDFTRRRLSVIVSTPDNRHVLICKGAVEEILAACTHYEAEGEKGTLDPTHLEQATQQTNALNADGFRVVAVAYREIAQHQTAYAVADETDLTLLGYIAFLDPPKDSARQAISQLAKRGVAVKILTGDNEVITRKVCKEVGITVGDVLVGGQIDAMADDALADLSEHTTVFAKLTPSQKERIVRLLRSRNHVVGFLGDGINDSSALKAADVGVSVDTAVDIAKEAADVILLEKSLLVLEAGVVEGRRVFANITKYIRMGASSNFGNMFSVLGASVFLPFLPMAPIQVLTNNLLYDFSQAAIPTDNVDESDIQLPRKWDIGGIFKFMVMIGPISSLFDYATFATMLWVFGAWDKPSLFQTGWFVESLLTQTLIIHIIRTAKIPFLQSRASASLLATTSIICCIGIALPYTTIGGYLGFQALPWGYWPLLLGMLVLYAFLTHWAKMHFARRWGM